MKQCPKCRTTYTDDGLRFCLADGAALTGVGEQETVAARRDNVVRVDVPPADPSPRTAGVVEPRQSSTGKIIGVIAAVGVLLLLAIVAVGALIYIGTRRDDPTPNKNVVANASPNQTPTPDAEKQRLQDELANIQRRLDQQQKNANRPASPPPVPSPNSPGTVTARVNSPNDGFLALRAQPDADYGDRIAKVPHGATVTIENCNRNKITIGARTGRWCLISWNGFEGYVFDAWLIY